MIHNYSGLTAFLSVFFAFAMIGTPCYPASDQEPTLLYVSPQGKDNASGTLEQPLRTIRTALLKTGAIDRNTPVKIILREGTYEQDATLVIDRDNVSILSYEGEKAIISGGKRLSPKQLKKVTAKDAWERIQPQVRERIREIDFQKLELPLEDVHVSGFGRPTLAAWTEVFINGQAGQLARWPNDSTVLIGKIKESGVASDGQEAPFPVFGYHEDRPSRWKDTKQMWISGYFAHGYADDMIRVARIDTVEKNIYTAQHTTYGFMTGKPWRRWFAVNLLEELDQPGEYVIDVSKGKIYLYLPDEKVEAVQVSLLGTPLLAIENCADVTVKGLTFEYGRHIAVYMENTSRCVVEKCIIHHMGSTGIVIGKGSQPASKDSGNHQEGGATASRTVGSLSGKIYQDILFNREGGTDNGVKDCHIYQVGAGGVNMGGGDRATLTPARNYVENCFIHDYNRIEKSYRPAIWIDGVGNRISRCTLCNAPSMAILMHGNDHIIELCDISNVCSEVDDQGAIYWGRDPSEQGNVIRNCYIHDLSCRHRVSGTYHDDGACGTEVYGNLYFRAGSLPVLIGGGHYNHYRHNIFLECPVAIHIDARMQGWGKFMLDKGGIIDQRLKTVNYQQPPYSTAYPSLPDYWKNNPAWPQNNVIEGNLFCRIGNVVRGRTEWLEMYNNWTMQGDPGWVDPSDPLKGLKDNAPVYQRIEGFPCLPFDSMGCKLPAALLAGKNLRLMSYNVRNGVGTDNKCDLGRIASVLLEVKPDVVAIQELDSMTNRSGQVFVLQELAHMTGLHPTFGAAIAYDGGKYGIGVLSKEKPLRTKQIALPGREEARTLLVVEFKDYILLATHLSLTPADQETAVSLIRQEAEMAGKPVFLAGDMNSTPSSVTQTRLQESFMTLTDPHWATCGGRCIDYIYVYRDRQTRFYIKDKTLVENHVASDHCPIWVDVLFSNVRDSD